MFQTSCGHHQEDHLYMQFLCYVLHLLDSLHKCVKNIEQKKPHVQMAFLMMTTWCSKRVEDMKDCIKTLIEKSAHFVF